MAELIRWAERLFLIPLSCLVIYRVWPHIADHPHMVLFLASEIVGVVLLLTQRRGTWSVDLYPLIVALLGTGVGLLVIPAGAQLVAEPISVMLVMTGAGISFLAKLFLGRSFGVVPANRGVKVYGVYRFVRHPMYLGYMINQLGFLLLFFSLHNVIIYAIAWLAFWLRATEEEKFLEKDEEYRLYREKVRYRLIPGVA